MRDGSVALVRLLRSTDKQLLVAGFEHLSPESRYRRFFTYKHRLTPKELAYLTEVDGEHHFALGAARVLADGSEQGLGVARFVRWPKEPDVAEAAIAVIDREQGKGLGSILLQRLFAAARERGVTRFRCDVLATNDAMKDLVRELAPQVEITSESGVAQLAFAIPGEEPVAWVPQSPPHRLLKLAAGGKLHLAHRPDPDAPDPDAPDPDAPDPDAPDPDAPEPDRRR